MVRLAIVSDTHVPSRAETIPEWVREEMASADHVIHAGDFDSEPVYRTVEEIAESLTAVTGNMDPHSLALPEVATLSLDGVRFVVTHGSGPVAGYRERVAGIVEEEDPTAIGVAGHTHQPMDEIVDGVRILNPGSATGASPAKAVSLMRAEVTDGDLEVEIRKP